MFNADLPEPRPSLTHPGLIARVVERLGQGTGSSALLPCAEPEPLWLTARAGQRRRG
jgi:hypothetical protein